MSFKEQLVSSVFFTAMSKYAGVVISLLVAAILSRLMPPEEFGVVAIATVFISFLSIFADLGLTSTIIQYKELKKSDLDILFSISCYLGLFLAVLFFFSSPFFAYYFNEPLLDPICKILAISLFFTTISVVPNAIFYREKMFKEAGIRGFLAQLFGGIVAVLWAWQGGGVYTLIISPVVSSVLIFIISFYRFPMRFQYRFSFALVSYVFKYSFFQFLFDIINFFSRNTDSLIIGKAMGPTVLGFYDKAYRLMLLPLRNITQVITPVLHPLLSGRTDEPDYLMKANEAMGKLFAVIGFPLSVWLFFSAEELIVMFFGDQWYASVPVFKILSVTVGLQLVLASAGSFFQTSGDTRSLFICGLFSAVFNVSAILVGTFYFHSIEAIAIGMIFTYTICFFQTYWLLYKKVFNTSCIRFFKIMLKPLFYSALLVLCYSILTRYVKVEESFVNLVWKTVVYMLTMIAIIFFGGYKAEILSLLKRKQLPVE